MTVHGSQVDITDTGIDRDFLEALPDDMREEIINQHFREARRRRPNGGQAGGAANAPAPSHISSEFLDALPDDIRAEVLANELAEQQRTAARAARSEGGEPAGGPVELDPATFFATLGDPDLRANVLLEQMQIGGPGFLASLPPNLLAEVEAIRSERGPRAGAGGASLAARTAERDALRRSVLGGNTANPAAKTGGPSTPREPVQLLDMLALHTSKNKLTQSSSCGLLHDNINPLPPLNALLYHLLHGIPNPHIT